MRPSRRRHDVRRAGPPRRPALLLAVSLAVVAPALCPALAQSSPAAGVVSADPHAAHVAEASRRFDVPQGWIFAVKRAESGGEVRAVSSAGAVGLMQIMPETWAELRARYGLGSDPFDPRDNILAGAAYLREMWDRYGDVAATLAAYNAGPARYDAHRANGLPLPAETRAYVASLARTMRGERPIKSSPAPARPSDWREAAIFVARAVDTPSADIAPTDRASNDARMPIAGSPERFAGSQSKALFVARDVPGERR